MSEVVLNRQNRLRQHHSQSFAKKILLLLLSFFFCMLVFVGLDGIYSALSRANLRFPLRQSCSAA